MTQLNRSDEAPGTKNGGVVTVSCEAMRDILGLSEDVYLRGMEYRWDRNCWDFYLSSYSGSTPASGFLSWGTAPPPEFRVGSLRHKTTHRGFGGKFFLYPVAEGQEFPRTCVEFFVSPKRDRAYQAIDSEREYQDRLWGNPEHDESETVGNFLIYIERYLNKAKNKFIDNSASSEALHEIRKIAALAVACMEQHGAPERR